MFFLRKINCSTFSAVSNDLCAETTSPAVEKTLSLGTDVAGMERYNLADFARWGRMASFDFHHAKGQSDSGILARLLYWLTSLSIAWKSDSSAGSTVS